MLSVAVSILAKLGYKVAASTGRAETHDYLRKLGAASIVDRASIEKLPASLPKGSNKAMPINTTTVPTAPPNKATRRKRTRAEWRVAAAKALAR